MLMLQIYIHLIYFWPIVFIHGNELDHFILLLGQSIVQFQKPLCIYASCMLSVKRILCVQLRTVSTMETRCKHCARGATRDHTAVNSCYWAYQGVHWLINLTSCWYYLLMSIMHCVHNYMSHVTLDIWLALFVYFVLALRHAIVF